ncbi:hypothetical protein ACVWW2_004683 [Bradyrhizobium sp. LM4.3]
MAPAPHSVMAGLVPAIQMVSHHITHLAITHFAARTSTVPVPVRP